jgi:hypothetical protein
MPHALLAICGDHVVHILLRKAGTAADYPKSVDLLKMNAGIVPPDHNILVPLLDPQGLSSAQRSLSVSELIPPATLPTPPHPEP